MITHAASKLSIPLRLVSRSLFLVILCCLCLHPVVVFAQSRSALAPPPDWSEVAAQQEVITHDEFTSLLERLYAPNGAATGLIDIQPDRASIVTELGQPARLELRFAPDAATRKAAPRFWRTRAELGPAPRGKPLQGLRIALDPGHLGGDWARMEGRWFRIGDTAPVMEGELTLRVSERLAPQLSALGAKVLWVRRSLGPVTHKRPADFLPMAGDLLAAQGITNPRITYESFDDPQRGNTLQSHAELMFYRQQEIRDRARLVNETLRPDLVLCLHFNAEAWGRDSAPDFVPHNHFHVLVNGCYSASELRLDDNRREMLLRLLSGVSAEEQRIATHVARVFAREAALPPWIYRGPSAVRVNDNPYVWARNLLANRLYRCPVVYLEPYVMNCEEVWERVQAGDYEGQRLVAGSMRPSIIREYANAVADSLAAAMRE